MHFLCTFRVPLGSFVGDLFPNEDHVLACAERETLVERIRSGIDEARRKGKHLGRPKGSTVSEADFLAKHRDVVRLLKDRQSVRNTAKISGNAASTVSRIKIALLPCVQ